MNKLILYIFLLATSSIALPTSELRPLPGQPFPKQAFRSDYQVYVFLSPECPLCQGYSVTLNQLQADYGSKVSIIGIFPGLSYPDTLYQAFKKKYAIHFPLLKDPSRHFMNALKASITPQVFLVDRSGKIRYQGSIDDRASSLGKTRIRPNHLYLELAIEDVLAGRSVTDPGEKAVGCRINDY